jgi:hypothetical protein
MKKENGSVLRGIVGELDDALIAEAAEPMTPSPQQETNRKKSIFLRRAAVIAAAVLLLCGLAVGTVMILDRRSPGVSAEKVPLCVTDDLEEFVAHWQATHDEQEMDFLVVPVCKTDEFIFVRAHENEYYYFYRFMPTGTVSDSSGMSPSLYDVRIEISLSKSDGSYAAVLDQFDLTDRGGKAFYAHSDQSKIWYINYNGHRLSVRFFNATPLQDPEDFRTVSDLFEFLVFTEDSIPTLPQKETATEPPVTDIP